MSARRIFPPAELGTVTLPPIDWDAYATGRWHTIGAAAWAVRDAAGALIAHVATDGPGDAYADALALLGCTRPYAASPVLAMFRDDWDDGDPWGSGMAAAFAVCDLLAMIGDGDLIPVSAGYRRAMLDVRTVETLDPEVDGVALCDLAAALRCQTITLDDLGRAARILNRYLDACRAAGVDY